METLDLPEVVTNGELAPAVIPVGDLSALEKKIEQGLAAYQRIIKMAIKYTHAGDWVNQAGIPYLMSTGAERIARPFGIYVKGVTLTKEPRSDAKGEYYIYLCKGTVGSKLLDSEVEFEGTCSSRDKFFGMTGKTLKPIEDVSEVDIRKKAYTNMFINGVTRLLGLRRLTWNFLAECGIKQADAAKVDYGGAGATTTISDGQIKMIYGKMKGLADLGADKAAVLNDFLGEFQVKEVKNLPKNKMNDAIVWLDSWKV
jgi:hypothetical protein